VLQPPSLTNQYAAMPSLHVGWNLLVGIAVVRHASWWAGKGFGMLMPAAMVAAVVLTANHYLLDAVAGGALALIGLAIARTLAGFSRRTSRQPRSAATAPGGSIADDRPWTPPGARAPGSRPTEPGSLGAY
jgi:hypothetical protein